MCNWEIYFCSCGNEEWQKMAYSCDLYKRHVYGPCNYDKRSDRARASIVPGDYQCSQCAALYQYVNV
jgi:hypothetical protein